VVKKRKILEKVLSGSKNVRFDEFTALLEGFGFKLDRVKGSHHIFINPNVPKSFPVQPKSNGQAKPYQIQQLLKLIDQYNLKLEGKDKEKSE